jgi:formylmethanofuran dehydrogenase subunit E
MNTTEDPLQNEDFLRCADFHGHVCPGLAIGYRAARAGLDRLKAYRSPDEELVAEVETDACGADAVQVLSGCTFGKGNLIYRDRGKQAFTFFDRGSGQGVRVAMKQGAFAPEPRQSELFAKMRDDSASREERKEFWDLHRRKSREVLLMEAEELFSFQDVQRSVPDKARIEPSEPCSACGEPTMASKLAAIGERKLCLDCADDHA